MTKVSDTESIYGVTEPLERKKRRPGVRPAAVYENKRLNPTLHTQTQRHHHTPTSAHPQVTKTGDKNEKNPAFSGGAGTPRSAGERDGALQCNVPPFLRLEKHCRKFGQFDYATNAITLFYSSAGGVLFDKSKSTLIQYPAGLNADYVIPSRVTNIELLAFTRSYAAFAQLPAPYLVTAGGLLSRGFKPQRFFTAMTWASWSFPRMSPA